jgi:hypothetical protein
MKFAMDALMVPLVLASCVALAAAGSVPAVVPNGVVSDATASCTRFVPGIPDPMTLCNGVVDYDFHLAAGESLGDLNTQALGMVTATWLTQTPTCQSSLKRMVCSEVYQPCTQSDVNDADTIVVTKPCVELCDAVAPACVPMPPIALGVDCTAAIFSNDTTTCNAMSTTNGVPLVASVTEPYIGSYCSDVVDYAIVVPQAPLISPFFAPMAGPYVVQSMIEVGLVSADATVPKWLPGSCLADTKILTCGSAFVKSFTYTLMPGVSFEVPSYLHRDFCSAIDTSCGGGTDGNPMVCDGTVPGTTMQMYPTDVQTIFTLDLSLFGMAGMLDVTAPPNTQMGGDAAVQEECPGPILKTYAGNKMYDTTIVLPGTACAVPAEQEQWCEGAAIVFSFHMIDLLLLSFAALNIYVTPANKRGPAHISFIVGSALVFICLVVLCWITKPTTLHNDTSPLGYSELDYVSIWMMFLDKYFRALVLDATFKMTAVELYMRVVWEQKKTMNIVIPCLVVVAYMWTVEIVLDVIYIDDTETFACDALPYTLLIPMNERCEDLRSDILFWPTLTLSVYCIGHSLFKLIRMAYMSGGTKAVITSLKTYSSLWVLAAANITMSAVSYTIMSWPFMDYEGLISCLLTNFISSEVTPNINHTCNRRSFGYVAGLTEYREIAILLFGAAFAFTTMSRSAITTYKSWMPSGLGIKGEKVNAMYASSVESSFEDDDKAKDLEDQTAGAEMKENN